MDRLAIAIGGDIGAGSDLLTVAVDRRLSDRLYRGRDQLLMLYRLVAEHAVQYVGLGRLSDIRPVEGSLDTVVQLSLLRPFEIPLMDWEASRLPRVRQMLVLSEERFRQIVEQATNADAVQLNAREMGVPFADAAALAARHIAIHDELLEEYSRSCPFTDFKFGPGPRPHPDLQIVALWPTEAGGPLRSSNFLPMSALVAASWRGGRLTLADDLAFVVDKSRIEPELDELLRPIGRLASSRSGKRPDPASLAFHRSRVFGR